MPVARFSPIGVGSTLRSLGITNDPGKVVTAWGFLTTSRIPISSALLGPIVPLKPVHHRDSEELTGLLVFPEAPHFAGPRLVVQ